MTIQGQITRVRLQKGRRLVKRGQIWYLETCIGGIQGRRSLGTGDLQEATRRAAEGGEPVLNTVLKPKPRQALTLGKALEEYEEWYKKNRRESEAKPLVAVLRHFIDQLGEEFDTRAVTRGQVQRWVDGRVDGRAPATVKRDFARVRAFLYWLARRKDAADMNSCRGIDKPKDDGTTRVAPSSEKVKAVIGKVRGHPWLADYCTLLAETGARPSELLGLRGIDVRENLCSIVPWEGRQLKSKWSKRVIELNAVAAEILKKRKDTMFNKALPIFANRFEEVYEENSVYRFFCDTLAGKRRARVPEAFKMTLYDFRHFFCSEHAAPGPQHMAIESLAAYIGHSPASTQTLLRWYTDQNALRRGAPVPLVGEPKEGKVIALGKAKAQVE
jgi:integrase